MLLIVIGLTIFHCMSCKKCFRCSNNMCVTFTKGVDTLAYCNDALDPRIFPDMVNYYDSLGYDTTHFIKSWDECKTQSQIENDNHHYQHVCVPK